MDKVSANEFANVRDIRGIFLYTKDGSVMCYLKMHPYNISLLSKEEKAGRTDVLAKSFDGDRKDFAYFAFPREIDLDDYKRDIKKKYDGAFHDFGRKHILNEMMMQATELETNGENYEHQHYIKLWRSAGSDVRETERFLRTRLAEFQERYAAAGIQTEILESGEIIKMCSLFGNAQQAPFDVPANAAYEPMMLLK